MDFLSQAMTQLRDLFASMTPAARITSTLLLGVIVVSLGYLFQGYSSGAKEYLFNGEMMMAEEAHRIEAALAKAKLNNWERQGDRILVPRGEKAVYLAAIADMGALPANFDTLLEQVSISPFESSDMRKARLKGIRERQLSMMLREMEGVANAKVICDIREIKGSLKEHISATVSIEPDLGSTLTPRMTKNIRAAVASGIGGKPTDVTMLNLSDGSRFDAAADVAADSFDDPYFQAKTNYELMMESKIIDLLRGIPGVRVKVSAELDPTLTAQMRSQKADDPAARRLTTQVASTITTEVDDRGRPGLTANGPGRTGPEFAVAKNENKIENESSETDNIVPMTEELITRAGLAPQHVRAAIAIPSAYLVQVWRERNKTAAADAEPSATDLGNIEKETHANITGMVSRLFPREPAEDLYANIDVKVFQSLTPEAIAPPSMSSEMLAWASSNSGSLIMSVLAVVCLLMLRGLLKSIPPAETKVILSGPALAAAAQLAPEQWQAAVGGRGEDDDEPAPGPRRSDERARPRLRLKKGPSMKDDLTDMVREDPDAAAAILRGWIGNAG